MKLVLLLSFISLLPQIIVGQTAEEILSKTESAYAKLSNYVDQGTVVPVYRSLPVPMDTTTYYMAIDRKGNVSYKLIKTLAGRTSGAIFEKAAKDSVGVYTRLGGEDTPFTCKIEEAHPRLMGTGGVMFYLIGSMFYEPTSLNGQTAPSLIRNFDTIKRLDDTTINGAICYVIKTRKTSMISEEMANKVNFQRDSMFGLLDIPIEQRGGLRTEAGPKTSEQKYFIRHADHMVVGVESYQITDKSEPPKFKSTLYLTPMYNVKGFRKYLEE